jgi:hypothetical protein
MPCAHMYIYRLSDVYAYIHTSETKRQANCTTGNQRSPRIVLPGLESDIFCRNYGWKLLRIAKTKIPRNCKWTVDLPVFSDVMIG